MSGCIGVFQDPKFEFLANIHNAIAEINIRQLESKKTRFIIIGGSLRRKFHEEIQREYQLGWHQQYMNSTVNRTFGGLQVIEVCSRNDILELGY